MDIFSALAEPNRRHIIELLSMKGELSATDISTKFKVSPQAISQHLKILKEANLVKVEKRAQQRIYKINPQKMGELETWIKKLTAQWDKKFEALDKVLASEKHKLKK